MKIDKLELLAMADNYEVKKNPSGYEIIPKDANLSADITDEGITYYVTGCYNSCGDEMIEIEALEKLKKFCELMVKE